MSDQRPAKSSLTMVLIFLVLAMSFIFVQMEVFDFFQKGDSYLVTKKQENGYWGEVADIKAAKGMYRTLKSDARPATFVDNSIAHRTLKGFYALRAYAGAPPSIPHPVSRRKTLTGDSCLGCHQYGGFTPKFDAYAPIVPHPEKLNCRQCHNLRHENSLYRGTNWAKYNGQRGFAHLPGSPLIIPHSIQMRENCLDCHTGPAAVREIRTTHPERINCMQCHVERKITKVWVRK